MLRFAELVARVAGGDVELALVQLSVVGQQPQVHRRVAARIQRRVGNALDALDQRQHLRIGHLFGPEVRQAATRRARSRWRRSTATLNCALTLGLSPRLKAWPTSLWQYGGSRTCTACTCAGLQVQGVHQVQHQLGHALRRAATRVLLEHHLHQPPLAAEALDHQRGLQPVAAVQVRVAIEAAQEVRRPGDAVLGHLRTFDAGLRHPALDHAHRQAAVDVALEAAAAAVEGQAQRMHASAAGSGRRMRAAAAVEAKTMATPVGSKPSYIDSVRLKRAPSSQPTASAARNSAPLQPPRKFGGGKVPPAPATSRCGCPAPWRRSSRARGTSCR